jgi:hypothetical protein
MKNFSLITRRCLSDIQKQGNVALENVERSLRVRAATRKFSLFFNEFFLISIDFE